MAFISAISCVFVVFVFHFIIKRKQNIKTYQIYLHMNEQQKWYEMKCNRRMCTREISNERKKFCEWANLWVCVWMFVPESSKSHI